MESLSQSNTYVSEKSHLTIRLKPKGVGELDKKVTGRTDNTSQSKFFESGSDENHQITFADSTRGKSESYDYPDTVATGEFDNSKIFKEIVEPRIPLILDGFNSHWIAYGQTGSGKSHTMIGPMGVFNTPAESIDDVDPHLGLFPRAAMILLKGIQ